MCSNFKIEHEHFEYMTQLYIAEGIDCMPRCLRGGE